MSKSKVVGSSEAHVAQEVKLNSRVTKAHIAELEGAIKYALDPGISPAQRLGYLSYAVASVLKDVGLPEAHMAISARMWANFATEAINKEA